MRPKVKGKGPRLGAVAIALTAALAAVTGRASVSWTADAPPGRAWAPTEVLTVPSAMDLGGGWMQTDSMGRPLLMVEAQWSPGQYDDIMLSRGDSSWRAPIALHMPLRFPPYRVVSSRGGLFYLTIDYDPVFDRNWLMFAELDSQGIAYEDTALRLVTTQSSEYAGAASVRRRWVARSEQRPPPDLSFHVRVAYSDTIGIWHEVESRGYDSILGCAIAPVSDTVALLAHSGYTIPLKVETLTNGAWTDSAIADPRLGKAIHPRFALRKSGGHWLAWSTVTSVRMASNQSGEWVVLDVLLGQHQPFETFATAWLDVSQDDRERPIVVWSDFGYGLTFRDVACAAFPTPTRWTPGYEIPDSGNQFLSPTVARDLNGDGWFAWKLLGQRIVKWTHTYVKATASKPWFSGPNSPVINWALSEPAYESRWTVLRAIGSGDFEPIASAIATEDTLMSYADTSAPAQQRIRYRIRRESVNRRYEWLSPETTWFPKKPRLQVASLGANPVRDRIEFTIDDASEGELDVRLYDIQGREVLREKARTSGRGGDVVRLDLSRAVARITSGLYFVRVTDAAGETSPPLKTIVLR